MSAGLTLKQAEVLAFMREFFEANDQLPPASVLRVRFGWASENSAATYLITLAKKGYIEHNAVGKYRFTRNTACASNAAASTTP